MEHQAFAQMLGNYGEFIGAIGVVVTLGYLAIQIRQNTDGLVQPIDIFWVQECSEARVGYERSHWVFSIKAPNKVLQFFFIVV